MKKICYFAILIGVILCMTACDNDNHSVIYYADWIIVNGSRVVDMNVGATTDIPSDGKKHQWQSQKPKVATIENDSTIRAIAVGKADIIDKADSCYKISVNVIE